MTHRLALSALVVFFALSSCAGDVNDGSGQDAGLSGDVGRAEGSGIFVEQPTTIDFIVTAFTFYVPEGIEESDERIDNPCAREGGSDNSRYNPLILDGLVVDGLDLDGEDTQGSGACAHRDYVGPAGLTGVDYGFLHVMDMIRPARPGQTIETVLASAPAQGLIRIGIRVSGVDDLVNDDSVRLLVTNIADTPLVGADRRPLAGGSVPAHNDPAFQSVLDGEIIDGVLHAGPADLAMGNINLLVIEDRSVTLRDARVRAEVRERATGGLEVDGFVAGWWERDDMIEAIGQAILSIGANPGELQCVLDQHLDHAIGGGACNAMSTILSISAVSGYITGLEEPPTGP